jgi:hypothetical protein
MALSIKNTLISLTLSGAMLFAGFISGENPLPFNHASTSNVAKNITFANTNQSKANADADKKTKRAFTTPYFAFGKSNLPVGVR